MEENGRKLRIEEKSENRQGVVRKQIRIEACQGFLQVRAIDDLRENEAEGKRKIPRPANAFMLFANERRRKLAAENPKESNKEISVRLGCLWKNASKEVKDQYFAKAKEVDAEHKKKYPGYTFLHFNFGNISYM